jgi:hypothetical protein
VIIELLQTVWVWIAFFCIELAREISSSQGVFWAKVLSTGCGAREYVGAYLGIAITGGFTLFREDAANRRYLEAILGATADVALSTVSMAFFGTLLIVFCNAKYGDQAVLAWMGLLILGSGPIK